MACLVAVRGCYVLCFQFRLLYVDSVCWWFGVLLLVGLDCYDCVFVLVWVCLVVVLLWFCDYMIVLCFCLVLRFGDLLAML